jgi:hypothetical protein
MASSEEEYSLSRISFPNDYPALTEILISSFKDNPYYYLTYVDASEGKINAYLASLIKFDQEGKGVQTIKIVHNQTKTIVAFATWLLGPKPQNETPERPAGADFRFLDDIKKKINQVTKATYDEHTDWSKF